MATQRLDEGWVRFGKGRRWRCAPPSYLCEVDDAGHVPTVLSRAGVRTSISRIHAAYDGRLSYGPLDGHGTALDVLTANALTESLGSVEMRASEPELREVYRRASGIDPGVRLDEVARYVRHRSRYLVRFEPGYVHPGATPGRISIGTHHMLVSTARAQLGAVPRDPVLLAERNADVVCRLGSRALYSARLAIDYFNRSRAEHENEPPLLAATYNAGSPRPDPTNAWNLRQHGDHIDRWVAFYNASRQSRGVTRPAAGGR